MYGWAVFKTKSNRTVERTVTESSRALNAYFILFSGELRDAEQAREKERKKKHAELNERENGKLRICTWCAKAFDSLAWLFGSVYSVNSIVVYYVVCCMYVLYRATFAILPYWPENLR